MIRPYSNIVSQCAALATMFLVCADAQCGVITVSADTYISPHSGLGGANQNHGSDDRMFLIGPVAAFQASPLIRFDLSAFAGTTLTNDLNLELDVVGTHSGQEMQSTVRVHQVLVPWDESTVTWNNFGSVAGLQPGIDFALNPLDTVAPLILDIGDTAEFTIPFSAVQAWIDNPASNFGLILVSSETDFNRDIHFGVREFGQAARLSSQQFSAPVPEPSSAFIFALGMGIAGLGVRRHRVLNDPS
jgi:hypothetical protein